MIIWRSRWSASFTVTLLLLLSSQLLLLLKPLLFQNERIRISLAFPKPNRSRRVVFSKIQTARVTQTPLAVLLFPPKRRICALTINANSRRSFCVCFPFPRRSCPVRFPTRTSFVRVRVVHFVWLYRSDVLLRLLVVPGRVVIPNLTVCKRRSSSCRRRLLLLLLKRHCKLRVHHCHLHVRVRVGHVKHTPSRLLLIRFARLPLLLLLLLLLLLHHHHLLHVLLPSARSRRSLLHLRPTRHALCHCHLIIIRLRVLLHHRRLRVLLLLLLLHVHLLLFSG
mmetsp:Transcript_1067/g.3949  ORF Transcript_1067/g.3949 Transcript_1067/m.3949 type:complete len:280 (-) Transcript_1067:754-1593(-)